MITIKDVARKANVSPGTISNVLTGKRAVAASTRQRILEVIKELGYQPNLLGRSLVNQRSESIGVVIYDALSYGNALIASGIMQETNEMGYTVMLTALHKLDKASAGEAISSLRTRKVDGIIWAVPEVGQSTSWIGDRQLLGLPPLMIIGNEARQGFSVVVTNSLGGGTKATQHLIDVGRQRIGLITGPLDWLLSRHRRNGWASALRAAGLSTDRSLQVEGDWSSAGGQDAFMRLLSQRPDIDAVFAGNDQMALGVLNAARVMGLRVPDDVAVIGFDNLPESAFFSPPLSTMQHDLVEIGRTATRQLQHMIETQQRGEDGTSSVTVVIEPKLVIRESTQRTRLEDNAGNGLEAHDLVRVSSDRAQLMRRKGGRSPEVGHPFRAAPAERL